MNMRKHKEGLVLSVIYLLSYNICFISVAVHMNKFLTNSGIRSFHLARNISGMEFACTLEIYFASLEITRSTMPIAGVRTQICCCRYS